MVQIESVITVVQVVVSVVFASRFWLPATEPRVQSAVSSPKARAELTLQRALILRRKLALLLNRLVHVRVSLIWLQELRRILHEVPLGWQFILWP